MARNADTQLAYDILRAIHEEVEGTPTSWAETAFTDVETVSNAIRVWLANGVLYDEDGNLYLTETGRSLLGLYVRPRQTVAA